VLVDRQRRRGNNEGYVLQKAIELKKIMKLEYRKGNSFAVLQAADLNQVAMDVNIKIGMNSEESSKIIQDLVELEKGMFDKFVGENPEVLLPSSYELENVFESDPLMEGLEQERCRAPEGSLKELDSSELRTEVVKKGKDRYKKKVKMIGSN
jgi:hypothetical protein